MRHPGRLTPSWVFGSSTIPLDANTVTVLRGHRTRQVHERLAAGPLYDDADLVFAREDGAPLHPDSLTDRFNKLVLGAELPRIRLHDLRHTWATLALAAGVHPKVVSERLGHAKVAFTMDVYQHAIPALQEEAASLVAGLVASA